MNHDALETVESLDKRLTTLEARFDPYFGLQVRAYEMEVQLIDQIGKQFASIALLLTYLKRGLSEIRDALPKNGTPT